MDKITKIISLEPFKSRLPGAIPGLIDLNIGQWGLNENGNWGLIISDLNIPGIGVLSYRTTIDRYHWIKRFYDNSTYYIDIINCDGVNEWVEYHDEMNYTGTTFVNELPTPGGTYRLIGLNEDVEIYVQYGKETIYNFIESSLIKLYIDPVIVENKEHPLVPEFIYGVEFDEWLDWMTNNQNSDDCCVKEIYEARGGDEMLNFLKNNQNFITNKIAEFNIHRRVPNAFLNININEQYEVLGEYTNAIQEWVPGRTYYRGDVVIFNNDAYKLTNAPSSGYSGYYDEEYKELYFDDASMSHWSLTYDSANGPTRTIRAVVESQLSAVKRLKISYDDDGNKLPGILISGNTLELEYIPNVAYNIEEITNSNGQTTYYGDIIEGINYTGSNINFVYYIGAEIALSSAGNDRRVRGGIKFEESYPYTGTSGNFVIDGQNRTLYYTKIDFSTQNIPIINNELDNTTRYAPTANITYDGNWLGTINIDGSTNSINVPVFREDYKIGITSNPKIDIDVNIDRGMNAAFERHLKLAEVKTLDALERYSNGSFFTMMSV